MDAQEDENAIVQKTFLKARAYRKFRWNFSPPGKTRPLRESNLGRARWAGPKSGPGAALPARPSPLVAFSCSQASLWGGGGLFWATFAPSSPAPCLVQGWGRNRAVNAKIRSVSRTDVALKSSRFRSIHGRPLEIRIRFWSAKVNFAAF